jgi:hypothetical protein
MKDKRVQWASSHNCVDRIPSNKLVFLVKAKLWAKKGTDFAGNYPTMPI